MAAARQRRDPSGDVRRPSLAARSALASPFALALLAACAPASPPASPTPAAPGAGFAAVIDSVIATPPLPRAHWGVLARDARSGTVLYASEPERLFIPASNAKLFVTAVALAELGPDYRYVTRVLATGGDAEDAVRELRVVASGDPTMSARFYPEHGAALDSLARQVREAGIHRADTLVVDASRFDSIFAHPAWEVSDLPGVFATPIGAFAVEEGAFSLVLYPGNGVGAAGRAEVVGGAHRQPVDARVVTDTAGARTTRTVDFTARRDTIHLTARIAAGATPDTIRLAVTNPVRYAAESLADALRARGVAVGAIRVLYDTAHARREAAAPDAAAREVARITSPPMSEIVAAILRPSQNWIAETLLKTLGAERDGYGTWSTGIAVKRDWLLDVARLDSGSFSFRDASGLSPQNVVAPEAVVRLLDFARTQPWGGVYRTAMPAPGMTGGTLASRLDGLEQRVQAKTGTISNVNGLSGYLVTAAGREVTFSIMTNGTGLPSGTVRPGIDRIVEVLAAEGRRD